ncbi:uncharacterized protein KABA2_04S12056 [Maudiozyma barnettii]|uniref:Zn(2)-C6 fungal-type domain-containing protein n=1 Tax=Maudiozyma barnettii TaxID=61262 RepID=A0A8H2VFJ7_9SACH|nr:hypothetical protein [Kazachstania barnettii]CAB4254689.1 similar to Saccharomyces cerevisiae YJL206C Putative protein of unknown function [Kazachstania barnettii]
MVDFRPRLLVLSADSKTHKLITKKTRVSRACLICRKKKRKCNGLNPCDFCKRYSFNCAYSDKKFSEISNDEIKALKKEKKNEILSNEILLLKGTTNNNEYVDNDDHSDFDYKNIAELLISKKVLEKIKKDNHSLEDRNIFMTNLIKKNINEEKSLLNLNFFNKSNKILLPPRDIALKLILNSWNYAGVLFRFYHRPTLINILDSLYENDGYPKNNEEIQAQSLIYAILAVGALFSKDEFNENDTRNRDFYNDEGIKFFNKARDMINFKEISDIYSIQALFMLTMFLQCSANLKSCYYYIGIAKRLALRERLHRKSSLIGPTLIEDESKKRLFWSIYKVDIYLNCILGLPCSIPENNVDQEFPLDIDDEKITAVSSLSDFSETLTNPSRIISSCGMNNEHTKLILIMLKIYEQLYPLNLQILDVEPSVIYQFEEQLNQWHIELPIPLSLGYNYSTSGERDHYLKPSKLLQLDYLLTKLILYKPFFHFISIDLSILSQLPNRRDLTFQVSMAHRCIDVSEEIIELATTMIDEDIINGSYWFSIHTIFHSVACLTVYRHILQTTKKDDHDYSEKDKDVEKYYQLGYDVLVKLKSNSIASERIYNVLNEIFEDFDSQMIKLSRQALFTLTNGYDYNSLINHSMMDMNSSTIPIPSTMIPEQQQNIPITTTTTASASSSLLPSNNHNTGNHFISNDSNNNNNHNHSIDETNSLFNLEDQAIYDEFLFDPQISLEKLLEDLGS